MRGAVQRLTVLGTGILVGAIFLGLCSGLPTGWSLSSKAEAWALMMTGPVLSIIFGMAYPPPILNASLIVAWITAPGIFSHPIKPNVVTGAITLIALFLWFWAGWLTMLAAVWGA
jgi:hypothetical protein